jgi:hypothetical protein
MVVELRRAVVLPQPAQQLAECVGASDTCGVCEAGVLDGFVEFGDVCGA